MSENEQDAPPVPDDVMLALGLVEGRTWPEDASRPGPHYWRIRRGDVETIHMDWCGIARRSAHRMPWFASDGKRPGEVLLWMQQLPAHRPCGRCWKSLVDLADAVGGVRVLVELSRLLEEERSA